MLPGIDARKVGDKLLAMGDVDRYPFATIVGLLNRAGGEDGGVTEVEGWF